MTNRRKFLGILGGGFILAAGGATLWASTRDPSGARAPWQAAGQDGERDARRRALSFAVLAPSPHNRQPWLVDLLVEDEITLFCDADRRLPHTDPYDRQITIGLGCFLELLVQAAAEDGYRADIVLFPEGEPQPRLDGRPVARVRMVADGSVRPDPLSAHVLSRRSNKEPYDLQRPVPPAALEAIAAAAQRGAVAHTGEAERVATLRDEAWAALYTEITHRETMQESVDLMRIGRAEIEANPDGIDIDGVVVEGLEQLGLFRREDLLDPSSSAFAQQLPMLRRPIETAMAFLWLTTPGNARVAQIGAGRDFVRLNLAATGLGVAMHPLSQALQEFPEMRPHFASIRQALGVAPEDTLQMLVRLGYGPDTGAGPRWPYETRIRSA